MIPMNHIVVTRQWEPKIMEIIRNWIFWYNLIYSLYSRAIFSPRGFYQFRGNSRCSRWSFHRRRTQNHAMRRRWFLSSRWYLKRRLHVIVAYHDTRVAGIAVGIEEERRLLDLRRVIIMRSFNVQYFVDVFGRRQCLELSIDFWCEEGGLDGGTVRHRLAFVEL